jgi:hypothetical protein
MSAHPKNRGLRVSLVMDHHSSSHLAYLLMNSVYRHAVSRKQAWREELRMTPAEEQQTPPIAEYTIENRP